MKDIRGDDIKIGDRVLSFSNKMLVLGTLSHETKGCFIVKLDNGGNLRFPKWERGDWVGYNEFEVETGNRWVGPNSIQQYSWSNKNANDSLQKGYTREIIYLGDRNTSYRWTNISDCIRLGIVKVDKEFKL